jgi:hypothetical protein
VFFLSFFLSFPCDGVSVRAWDIPLRIFFLVLGHVDVAATLFFYELVVDWRVEGHLMASYRATMNEIERKEHGWMVAFVRVWIAVFPLWMGMAGGGEVD